MKTEKMAAECGREKKNDVGIPTQPLMKAGTQHGFFLLAYIAINPLWSVPA